VFFVVKNTLPQRAQRKHKGAQKGKKPSFRA